MFALLHLFNTNATTSFSSQSFLFSKIKLQLKWRSEKHREEVLLIYTKNLHPLLIAQRTLWSKWFAHFLLSLHKQWPGWSRKKLKCDELLYDKLKTLVAKLLPHKGASKVEWFYRQRAFAYKLAIKILFFCCVALAIFLSTRQTWQSRKIYKTEYTGLLSLMLTFE